MHWALRAGGIWMTHSFDAAQFRWTKWLIKTLFNLIGPLDSKRCECNLFSVYRLWTLLDSRCRTDVSSLFAIWTNQNGHKYIYCVKRILLGLEALRITLFVILTWHKRSKKMFYSLALSNGIGIAAWIVWDTVLALVQLIAEREYFIYFLFTNFPLEQMLTATF